jgi:predicted CXXCH cytochrome family protein
VGRAALIVSASIAVLPVRASAQWPNGITIDQTPHNLTRPASNTNPDMVGRIRNYGEICTYCHTPHGGPNWQGAPRAPLVNRPRPNPQYRMPEFGAQRMIQDAAPSDRSRICLSCHDGSVGLDQIANLPNTYTGAGPAAQTIDECEGCHSGGSPAGGVNWEGVWIAPDMRKQHPFSVLYDPTRRPGAFNAAVGGAVGGLPLWNGKAECATCHEPHSERNRYFLRVPNVSNSMCLICHTSQPTSPVHSR